MPAASNGEREPLLPRSANGASSSVAAASNGNGHSSSQLKALLASDVTPEESKLPLLLQCFLAGLSDALAFTQTKTWVAFMTGNLTQLLIGVTALVFHLFRHGHLVPSHSRPSDTSDIFAHYDRVLASSCSVGAFALGCLVCQRLTSRYGDKHRGKLVGVAVVRATITSAVVVGEAFFPKSFALGRSNVVLALLAFNMGLQAVCGQRMSYAPFATTVVFTATLTQIMADPGFPLLGAAGRWRLASVVGLVSGAAVAQSVLELNVGGRGVLCGLVAVAVGEIGLAASWLWKSGRAEK